MSEINAKYIRGTFRVDKLGGYVWGPNDFMFAQVRGWGQLQKLPNGGEIQDANLEHMGRALNSHFPMLEALKLVEDALKSYIEDEEDEPYVFAQIRTAIAKAEGNK